MAHNADEHSHAHGDHHPGGGNAAGEGQLIFIPDGHEAHQNMGHAEVAQAPGHHGDDADKAVGFGGAGGRVIGLGKAEEAGQGAGVVQHGAQAPGLGNAEHHNDGQSCGHDNGLNQVHGGHGRKAAHRGVADDNNSADDHRRHVVPAE